MKRSLFLQTLSLFVLAIFFSLSSCAQNSPASPPAKASGKIGAANVTIDYSSPSVKGRQIFGGLVPYDKVWRAGANTATSLETDKDLMIGGKKLPAGKYSLFATPGEKEWTIILNSETGQWGIKRGGEANRDPAKDVLTVKATPRKSASMNERLAYIVNSDGIVLQWENVEVPIAVK
jgi:hypothetical protein